MTEPTNQQLADELRRVRENDDRAHQKIEGRLAKVEGHQERTGEQVQELVDGQKIEAKFRTEILTGRRWLFRIFAAAGWLIGMLIAGWAAVKPHNH